MSFEKYTEIMNASHGSAVLRSGKEGKDISFTLDPEEGKRYRLFTTGNTCQFYQWKNEPDAHFQYALLNDSLDTEHAVFSQYCLDFSSPKPVGYVRRIHKKLLWRPVLSYLKMTPVPSDWRFGFHACAKDLKIHREDGGYLRMNLEIRLRHEGVSPHSNAYPPDKIYTLDFEEGSYPQREFSALADIDPDSTASVSVWIEGCGYEGEVYLEKPFLTSSTGYDLLPDFSLPVCGKEKFAWTGQYFSRKEWPVFRVSLNGERIFEGEIFERCHMGSEWEIDLPTHLLRKENTLTYQLITQCHDPLPYSIDSVGIIESPSGFALISATEFSKVGGRAYILFTTDTEETNITLTVPTEHLGGKSQYSFHGKGLHAIGLDCLKSGENIPFTLQCGDAVLRGAISFIAEGCDDGVITGTGDMVYIMQNVRDMEDYLCWYLSSHIGNMITARPTYRWSGTREINKETWELFCRIMNECSVKYVLMTDGREPVGLNTNPDSDMLAGERYLGRQTHEIDGAMFYWRTRPASCDMSTEQYADMFLRIYKEDPAHCWGRYSPDTYVYDRCGDNTYLYRDPTVPRDMKAAAQSAVSRLALYGRDCSRHTGPSVFFKYFAQAGFSWVGAETMYSTMEILLSFLRGVKNSFALEAVGVHHATQWSSSPHDDEEHFRRYRLALYVSYMLGADHINTEEGLWRLEEYYSRFHRFSRGCLGHTKQQQYFYKYISTHTRRGKHYTPMALIHGRYDGWCGFGNDKTWGWQKIGELARGINTDAENSWKLFETFYPQAKAGDTLYFHNCPKDRPMGYHSHTPMGQVDTVPIEDSKLGASPYKALAFMGYNMGTSEDMSRLADYVRGGGCLIMTRAHMTTTTSLKDIAENRLEYNYSEGENPLSFSEGRPLFVTDSRGGVPVEVCSNLSLAGLDILEYTDGGRPLVCQYTLGRGRVILFNANAYPAHEAIRGLYANTLKSTALALTREEPIWAEGDEGVEFAVYDTPNGERHIYLIAVDWYKDPSALRHARIRVGEHKYSIALPFGVMLKCVCRGNTLVYPHSEVGDILGIDDDGKPTLSAPENTPFTLCRNGKEYIIKA